MATPKHVNNKSTDLPMSYVRTSSILNTTTEAVLYRQWLTFQQQYKQDIISYRQRKVIYLHEGTIL